MTQCQLLAARRFAATAAAILLLIAIGCPQAHAQRVVHRVRFGETLQSISDHYYGAAEHAQFISLTNGLDDNSPKAGDRLRLPTAWFYTVPKRTTVERLAKRLLGGRRQAVALETFNRLGRRKRVAAGTRLLVPFTLSHVARAGETFASISTRYYRSPARAKLIAAYNGLTGAQPAAGAQLAIPIARVRITADRLRQLTNHRVLGISPERQRDDREALQEANGMLRRGEFYRVPLRLVRLLAREQPSDTYTAEVYKLLATAYVAIGQPELATRAFEEALLRQPTMTLDAVTTSPKVIRAFSDAKRARRSGN